MKENIINGIKLLLLFTTGMFGFLTIYALTWMIAGLPVENWSFLLCAALAILSELGLFRWLVEG